MIILLVLLMTGIVDVLFNPIFRLLWGLLPFGFSFCPVELRAPPPMFREDEGRRELQENK